MGFAVSALIGVAAPIYAEPATQPSGGSLFPPVHLTSEQDHQRVMNLLHITSLPPGASGQHPNLNESKANPFPNLPDPLVLNNGAKVTTARMWWTQRRPEILEYFEREIYGRTPKNTPKVTWELTKTENNGKTITKHLVGHVDNSSYPLITVNIELTLTTPANATGPVPVMMQFNGGPFLFGRRRPGTRPGMTTRPAGARFGGFGAPSGPTWQQQVLAKGWGYATINTSTIQADNGAGLTSGIIGLVNKGQPRALDDWGALAAWAWGGSRALDYFETDPAVDAKEVGIEGHSRWGKCTLLAMALDQRFAIAYVSSSGEGGAKLYRRNWGELVENVASSGEYHWMAGNFLKYAGHWSDLPVDSHELIALCAPRPVFISGGITQGDAWVDARGMFMATAAASPVYELLGKKGLGTTEMPPVGAPLIDGDLAFRQHNGGHTDALNWPTFIQFASRYLKTPPATAASESK
ncbi:MAG TPA: hypothetical protein VHX86_15630 [Tepidisphaeraceae bacterium]|nr:hypothetical protein [Tepidisphaeraceae bacterium]